MSDECVAVAERYVLLLPTCENFALSTGPHVWRLPVAWLMKRSVAMRYDYKTMPAQKAKGLHFSAFHNEE